MDAEESRMSARTLVLKGHSDPVSCLAALDGGLLASGSWDNSVVIWSLADGSQLAKLEGDNLRPLFIRVCRHLWELMDGG